MKSRKTAVPVLLGWPPENLLKQQGVFRKKVIWDCHGPLYDWVTVFCAVAGELYGVQLDPAAVTYYCLGYDADFPLSPREFNHAFTVMVQMNQGYGGLKLQPLVARTMRRIQAAGIEQEIWTYVPGASDHEADNLVSYGTGISQAQTYALIKRDLAFLGDPKKVVRFIKPGSKALCMAKESIPLIIEDCPSTAVAVAAEFGNGAILLPEVKVNTLIQCPGVYRLPDRKDLAKVVIDFFKALEAAGCLE